MRTHADRLRHTLLYELIGLVVFTPLVSWVLDREMLRVGILAVSMSLAAMICNYLFNLAFDHLLLHLGHPLNVRPPWLRALHALSFEISLTAVTVPLISWGLAMPLWDALLTDIGFTVFFLFYTYIFNWAYDTAFPMPVPATTDSESSGD